MFRGEHALRRYPTGEERSTIKEDLIIIYMNNLDVLHANSAKQHALQELLQSKQNPDLITPGIV